MYSYICQRKIHIFNLIYYRDLLNIPNVDNIESVGDISTAENLLYLGIKL